MQSADCEGPDRVRVIVLNELGIEPVFTKTGLIVSLREKSAIILYPGCQDQLHVGYSQTFDLE